MPQQHCSSGYRLFVTLGGLWLAAAACTGHSDVGGNSTGDSTARGGSGGRAGQAAGASGGGESAGSPESAAASGAGGSNDGALGSEVGAAGEQTTWQPGPSCSGLADTCGPDQHHNCCASPVVPGGTFLRDNGISGNTQATVSAFRLDAYEVTVGRFRNFVKSYADHKPAVGSGRNPNNDLDKGWDAAWDDSLPVDEAQLIEHVQVCDSRFASYAADDETLPMNCITWFEAYAFCIWDGGRLPTDAETNYAAAGGAEQRAFPWSVPPDSVELDDSRATYLSSDASVPAPVGSKSPQGDGRWGQADLSGNEWEWCQDWYRPFPDRCINCADLNAYSIRVIRGGSFYSDQESLYTTSRLYHAPGQADFGVGVRCARAP